jgi:Arm DNA-binding domain
VASTGAKSFRLDLTIQGKRKTITIGKYPEISLKNARMLALERRKDFRDGNVAVSKKDAI